MVDFQPERQDHLNPSVMGNARTNEVDRIHRIDTMSVALSCLPASGEDKRATTSSVLRTSQIYHPSKAD
jgi:hypothetical protein